MRAPRVLQVLHDAAGPPAAQPASGALGGKRVARESKRRCLRLLRAYQMLQERLTPSLTAQKRIPVEQPLQCCRGTAAGFVLELKLSGCYTKPTSMPPMRCPVQPSRRIACPTCRAPAKVSDLVYIDARLASPNKVWAAVLIKTMESIGCVICRHARVRCLFAWCCL